MAFILKAIGGIAALLLLITTLFGTVIAVGGFLLAAVKVLIIVIFVAVLAIIGFSIIRDRTRKRRESSSFS